MLAVHENEARTFFFYSHPKSGVQWVFPQLISFFLIKKIFNGITKFISKDEAFNKLLGKQVSYLKGKKSIYYLIFHMQVSSIWIQELYIKMEA